MSTFRKLINSLILDMDGVLWRGDQEIGNLSNIFSEISSLNLSVTLATNNSTLDAAQYIAKLANYDVDLDIDQIVNSSQTTSLILNHEFPSGGPVYIIGEIGLLQSLRENNFYHSESNSLAVVIGLDRELTYEKLERATLLLNQGLPFYVTNPDNTFPSPEGLVPGAGAILAALEAASGVTAHNIGKPSPDMYHVALERMGSAPDETLVIGDRLETDIAGAQSIGCRTALVLSGVTNRTTANEWQPAPDIIAADLESVLSMLA